MQSLAGPALLLVLCIAFCWKLTLTNQYTWIDNPDIARMDVPRLQFQRLAWRQYHEFPLWDPYLWCGQPFLGEIVGAAFPLNWPLVWLPGPDRISLTTLNWYFLALHFLAGLAAYLLCRELACSQTASVLGGILYSFCGFVGLTHWPEVFGALLMAPLVLLFLLRAIRGSRPWGNAALCGMFLGLAWLSGHHEIPIYLSTTVAAVWAWEIAARPGARARRLAQLAVAMGFAILVGAFQTIPGYEYAQLAVRWVGADHPVGWQEAIPYSVDDQYSFMPSSLISVIVPWSAPATEAFLGVAGLSLALMAVFGRWRERHVPVLACMSLAGLLLALGARNPVHGVLYSVLPLFGKARTPLRILSIFFLGMAPLAALGADALRAASSMSAAKSIARWLAGFGVGVFALFAALHSLGKSLEDSFIMAGLVALLATALYMARSRGYISGSVAVAAALCLVFTELGNGSAAVYRPRNPAPGQSFLPDLTRFGRVSQFLRAQPQPVRVYATQVTDAFNLGDWDGIETLNGFGAGVTANTFSLDWPSVRIQNLWGVNYALAGPKQTPPPDQQVVFRDSGGISVLKNDNAFPRAWLVHNIATAPSSEELSAIMNDPSIDLRTTAVMTGAAPVLAACAAGEAGVAKQTANTVTVNARVACRGMLILADTYYPGWTAQVDGRAAPIYEVDGALRGVVLEAGAHRIVFRFRPFSALLGGILSLFGVIGACLMAAFADRDNGVAAPSK